jgi:hypothetical protein
LPLQTGRRSQEDDAVSIGDHALRKLERTRSSIALRSRKILMYVKNSHEIDLFSLQGNALPTDRPTRPDCIALPKPLFDDHASFGHRPEQSAIQAGGSKGFINSSFI